MVKKGEIVRFTGSTSLICGTLAWVRPAEDEDQLHMAVVPERLRPKGILRTGTEVVYAYLEDYTGIIIERADGVEQAT